MKFHITVVGCGGMSNSWIQHALEREDIEIVALVDVHTEHAEALKHTYHLNSEIYQDIQTALENTNTHVVYNITPPELHREIVVTSLCSGCHVFGEKPMAISMEQAREIAEISKKTHKHYFVMQNRRYLQNIRSLRKIIHEGSIGVPGVICADFFLGPHFGGFRETMDSPLIMDMAIHTFDQARFITGQDAVSVYCHEMNPTGSWFRGNAVAICTFEMTDGSVFSYRGSWCAEGMPTSWQASWRITGSLGTALWDGDHAPCYEKVMLSDTQDLIRPVVRVNPPVDWEGREGHFGCLDEMFLALQEGRKAETDCSDNIKSMAMVFGAIQSAREKRKVILTP